MRFMAPLRSCDHFRVGVRVGRISAARATFEQDIVRLQRAQPHVRM